MVHIVLMIALTRRDHVPVARRVLRAEKAPLGCGVAMRGKEKIRAAARALDSDVKVLVLFFVNQRVGVSSRPQAVSVEPVLALGRVLDRVEKRTVVPGQCDGAGGLDLIRVELTRPHVAHAECGFAYAP